MEAQLFKRKTPLMCSSLLCKLVKRKANLEFLFASRNEGRRFLLVGIEKAPTACAALILFFAKLHLEACLVLETAPPLFDIEGRVTAVFIILLVRDH